VGDVEGVSVKETHPVVLKLGLMALEGEGAREPLTDPEAVLHA